MQVRYRSLTDPLFKEAFKTVRRNPQFKQWSDIEFAVAVHAATVGMTLIKEEWQDGDIYRLSRHDGELSDPMTLDGAHAALRILEWWSERGEKS